MTAACLTLLGRVNRPVWPFEPASRAKLMEAFPAAQLRQWDLPHQGYGKPVEGAATRRAIVDRLAKRIALGPFEKLVLESADALDAVLCAYAAKAGTTGALRADPSPISRVEGWIAVHR